MSLVSAGERAIGSQMESINDEPASAGLVKGETSMIYVNEQMIEEESDPDMPSSVDI